MEILLDIFKTYGWHGVSVAISGFLIWKHYIEPKAKKKKGTYESWPMMVNRIDDISMRTSMVQNKLDHHLEKETEEDLRMERMEGEIFSIQDKSETEFTHVFGQLKSIHEKIDALIRIMLERK